MTTYRTQNRAVWLTIGLVAGLAIATLWPHEPLSAGSSDRSEKFAIITAPVAVGAEAVFVLDFLTGRLTGASLNRTRQGTAFVQFYFRNLTDDFNLGGGDPNFAITAGFAELQNRGGAQWGSNAIYVAELNSGMVRAYAVPYRVTQVKQPAVGLFPVDQFPFREQNVTE